MVLDDLIQLIKSRKNGDANKSYTARLFNQGFRCALVKNKRGSTYIMLVDKNKLKKFNNYILREDNRVLMWLDEL